LVVELPLVVASLTLSGIEPPETTSHVELVVELEDEPEDPDASISAPAVTDVPEDIWVAVGLTDADTLGL
jgi:hypothetical protein